VVRHRPVYALGEWVAPHDPAMLGLAAGDSSALNDDRAGRSLDRLFDTDRASLITETVLSVIRDFRVEVSRLHNDSTTVTLTGEYAQADGRIRGGRATPAIVQGHNKDHRPDLKQLPWILTVSADGAVPVAYRVVDGNTPDDLTHIPTWDELHCLVTAAHARVEREGDGGMTAAAEVGQWAVSVEYELLVQPRSRLSGCAARVVVAIVALGGGVHSRCTRCGEVRLAAGAG
jgi:hypothetical protein